MTTAAAASPPQQQQQQQQRSAVRSLSGVEQYLCGALGGLGKVVTGHPFDTVKGRVQSGAFPNARTALAQTVKVEGAWALYQGVLPPCVSVGILSGIMFWANGKIRSALQPDPARPLTYTQMAIAGGGAGALTAVILTPLDQMKIWLQVERRLGGSAAAPATAPTDGMVRNMRRVAGQIGAPQLYRGTVATTLREIGTFGIFFPTNEFFKASLASRLDVDPAQPLPLAWRLLAAGTAGVLCWLPAYPVDQVKTRQQLQGNPLVGSGKPVAAWQGKSMAWWAGEIYRTEGTRGFFKGIAPCLLRAFPTYAAQFSIYDSLTRFLSRRE